MPTESEPPPLTEVTTDELLRRLSELAGRRRDALDEESRAIEALTPILDELNRRRIGFNRLSEFSGIANGSIQRWVSRYRERS